MIYAVVELVRLIALLFFLFLTISCTAMAVVRYRERRSPIVYPILALLSGAVTWYIHTHDPYTVESTDRADSLEAFRSNFGFDAPPAVEEIMQKHIVVNDADGYWMSFTYDRETFEKILAHDQPLQIIEAGTAEFDKAVNDAYERQGNRPDWNTSPEGRSKRIYFKRDFLEQHNFSEYYLWVDTTENMVHLNVGYF